MPTLKLHVFVGLEDWDIVANKDVPHHRISQLIDKNSLLGSITGTITNHVGKTVSQVSKAMGECHTSGAYTNQSRGLYSE